MGFEAQQVTVSRQGVDADEDGLTLLEDLVVGADPDAAEVLLLVDLAGQWDRCLDDVVDRAERDVVVKEITEQFDDATKRGVTDQHQTEDELPEPVFGDRQLKEDLVVVRQGIESEVEGGGGDGLLLVNKLATDLSLLGQF